MTDEPEQAGSDLSPIPIEAVPGLARIAVGAWVRGAVWGVETSLKATRRVAEAAISGESAQELITDVRDEAVGNLRRVLGVVDGDPRTQPITDRLNRSAPSPERAREQRLDELRSRGAQLLDRASDVHDNTVAIHPGFERIVDQLAPDEARILKLLYNEGPQPIVYINKAAPLGLGAREVARRLSLIGREAGCMHPELVPAYLDNLVRLGVVAIRRDPVGDEQTYSVVEAQPEVVEAIQSVKSFPFSGQSSRRSVHITDFGKSFCRICFPPEQMTGEFDAIVLDDEVEIIPPEADLDGAH